MKTLEERYLVADRTQAMLETTSKEELLAHAKAELLECEDAWSLYSGDGLGHAMTFYRLQINYLEKLPHPPKKN